VLDFILQVIQTPAIILGLVALIGLSIQKKSGGQIFSGALKTALGMIMVSAGAGFLVTNILPFVVLFNEVFGLTGFATGSEAVVGAIQNSVPVIARTSSLILALGFLVNIIIARFSPLKYIFLTGHMTWILSVAVAHAFYTAGFDETIIIALGSVVQGLLMVILPAIGQPLVRKLTGNDNFAIAHLTTLGTVPAGYIGGLLGDKSKDAEALKMPKQLEFFKDTAVSISIVMGLFYLVVTILAGPEVVSEFAGTQNYIVFALISSMGFAVGILILLQGIRMFLGEIVPAFKGISDKLVPGAIPALDVPVLFGFAPNSLMIGFVTAVAGMIVAMFVSSVIFDAVPLVSIIGAFFTGGVAGIFGNAKGGRRGAVIAGFVYGFMLIFGSAFISTFIDFAAYGAYGVGHDCIDAMVVMGIMRNVYVGIGIIVVAFIGLCMVEKKYKHRVESK